MDTMERNNDKNIFTIDNAHDIDLYILSKIRTLIEISCNALFVLTGSYALEALTGDDLIHEDIDSNILCVDIPKSMELVSKHIFDTFPKEAFLMVRTADRLEYNLDFGKIRTLEMQFVKMKEPFLLQKTVNFMILAKNSDWVELPTVFEPLYSSFGEKSYFRVKSLPYSIATWAIRISGNAANPKRQIKQKDLIGFKLLLKKKI